MANFLQNSCREKNFFSPIIFVAFLHKEMEMITKDLQKSIKEKNRND